MTSDSPPRSGGEVGVLGLGELGAFGLEAVSCVLGGLVSEAWVAPEFWVAVQSLPWSSWSKCWASSKVSDLKSRKVAGAYGTNIVFHRKSSWTLVLSCRHGLEVVVWGDLWDELRLPPKIFQVLCLGLRFGQARLEQGIHAGLALAITSPPW